MSFNVFDLTTKDFEQVGEKKKSKKPWIEKYRPRKLDQVMDQTHAINMLKQVVQTGDLPHLLLYGPAGTGKTSTIFAAARELYGPKVFRKRVIELNASDERGINIVRNKIVKFAKMAPCSHDPNYADLSYKLIILDEADAMTIEAQSALRKVMEDYSRITRFCFICNYVKKIIEPINSRCVKFRFKPISQKKIINRLSFIAEKEGININKNAIMEITNMTRGDLRKSIMHLQNSKYIYKPIITIEDIKDISGHVSSDIINEINDKCIMINKINSLDVHNLAKHINAIGYPMENIIIKILDLVINSENLTDKQKGLISIHIGNTDKKISDGADEYLQLLSIFANIQMVKTNNIS